MADNYDLHVKQVDVNIWACFYANILYLTLLFFMCWVVKL